MSKRLNVDNKLLIIHCLFVVLLGVKCVGSECFGGFISVDGRMHCAISMSGTIGRSLAKAVLYCTV